MSVPTVEQFFLERVRHLGGAFVRVAPPHQENSDWIILLHGSHFVELLAAGADRTVSQRSWHIKALQVGVPVHTVVGKSGAVSWLRALVNASQPPPKRPGRPRKDCTCLGVSAAMIFFREQKIWTGREIHPCDRLDGMTG